MSAQLPLPLYGLKLFFSVKSSVRRRGSRFFAVAFLAAVLLGCSLVSGSASATGPGRTVRVGVYQNEPKIFVDEDGQATGLFVDLLDDIGKQEGWNLRYVACEWADCLAALERGQLDLMPDVAISPQRERLYDFHKIAVVESWSRIYERSGVDIERLADLDGKRVAVLGDSIQQTVFERTMRGFGFDVNVVPVTSLKEAFKGTEEGQTDAVIANHFFGDFFHQDYDLSGTPIVFNMATLYYATAQGKNADLLAGIDRQLGRWLKQPQSPYYTTLLRWTERKPQSRVPEIVYWVVGGISLLLLSVFGVAVLLRLQVRSRTRHLERALETLRESEQRFRRLAGEWQTTFDATHDAIWVLDAEQRVIRANKAMGQAFGRSNSELIGKRAYEIVYNASESPPGSPFIKMKQSLKRESVQMEIGGHWFNVAVDPILDPDGMLVGGVATARDITERRKVDEEREKLEAQLIQTQRIEAIGRLAGGVAHDFNNMLGIILGYGELLLARLEKDDPLREDVEAIVDAGKRSGVLTGQLLAFSRQQTLQAEVVDLGDVVKAVEKMLRSLIREDIELKLILRDGLAPVMADAGQIQQVVVNLVINARDAMPNGGELIIETESVTLDETYATSHPSVVPGDYVMLAVTDTGHGMEKEVLDRIFEPFYTTKEKGKGTGLGLATAYGIVKQSGGLIYAYSEPERGTTFKIYLPQTRSKPGAEDGRAAEVKKGEGQLVLVVEDEAPLRKLMEEMLVKLGYRVSLAADANEAISLIEDDGLEPDLLMTDVIMPGMDGAALVKRLRQKHPALDVLYMSGYTPNAVIEQGVLDQGTFFIEKPINLDSLARRVGEAISAAGK